jgi:hypothetical protein
MGLEHQAKMYDTTVTINAEVYLHLIRDWRRGKQVTDCCTQNGACTYVPPVVLLGIYSRPTCVAGHQEGRYAYLPAILTSEEGGTVETSTRMPGWEGILTTIGSTFFG